MRQVTSAALRAEFITLVEDLMRRYDADFTRGYVASIEFSDSDGDEFKATTRVE